MWTRAGAGFAPTSGKPYKMVKIVNRASEVRQRPGGCSIGRLDDFV